MNLFLLTTLGMRKFYSNWGGCITKIDLLSRTKSLPSTIFTFGTDAVIQTLQVQTYMAGQKYNNVYISLRSGLTWSPSLYESCNSQISDVIDAYARASELDPGNHVISQRLQLLKKAQATGDPLPAAPGPQDLRLDGTVDIDITHQNGSTAIYPLSRLTKLYDSLEQFEDDGWEGEEDGSDQGSHVDNANGVWHQDSDGWRYDPDDSEWEDEEDGDEDGGGMEVDTWADDIDIPLSDSIPDSLIQRYVSPDVADLASPFPVSSSNTSSDSTQEIIVQGDEDGHADTPWKKFEVLPGTLRDHAFYSSVSNQPSKNYLARLTKEYRALSTSLPDSILVHAYEDRTDLLRCLIIGTENTPYEDAPFVIDWMLDSNFPQSPPIAHFLSWTNGNGRVNPNLYEEGKVCLSILGTWSGDRTETWSTARSSLLQASVSIQGLVLVKEPWFCEPAYEKLRGTEEGMVNSQLYSEKAYVLSRGFVRRALEIPVGGLEAEIDWLYNTQGRLARVLDDSRALIQKSQSGPENADTDQNLDLHIPSPAPAPASRSSPGPFRGGPPLPVLLDESHHMHYIHLTPMDVDRPPHPRDHSGSSREDPSCGPTGHQTLLHSSSCSSSKYKRKSFVTPLFMVMLSTQGPFNGCFTTAHHTSHTFVLQVLGTPILHAHSSCDTVTNEKLATPSWKQTRPMPLLLLHVK
ncbi:hypothetical protein F4604DRAFT_1998295 [Suillus subluteus]|nr:hypothetical protein F4604DRAFT_1998295 [Suillus subluteus]